MSEHTDKLYVIVSARMGGAVTRDPAKAAYSAITAQPADVVVIDIKAGEWAFYSADDVRHVGSAIEEVLSVAPGQDIRQAIE